MSFNLASRAELWAGATFIQTLAIEDGTSVTVDRSNLIRRTCQAVLTDPNGTLVAANVPQILAPYGNEIRLYYGVTYDDGTTELVLTGVFGIEDVSIDDTGGDLQITVDGMGRERAVQRCLFQDTYTIQGNTEIGLAIQNIITSLPLPFAPIFSLAPPIATTPSTPVVYNAGDDPMQACSDLAAGVGCEFFADPNGTFTLLPVPDPTLQPLAWTYDADALPAENIAEQLNRTLSRATAANYIIRDGAGTGAPIRAIAQDSDPTSPTWVGGPYGVVPDYQSSTLLTTLAQAQAAANAALLVNLGSIETLTITGLVRPDADVDDVVAVSRNRAGIAALTLYVTDAVTIGFGPGGTQTLTTRKVSS